MAKLNKHVIHVVPFAGETLLSDTKREWEHGMDFKVVASDSMMFQPRSSITKADVDTAEHYYPVRFFIEFIHQTVAEYFKCTADDDYVTERYIEILTKGQ
jgi:hypothetical protein